MQFPVLQIGVNLFCWIHKRDRFLHCIMLMLSLWWFPEMLEVAGEIVVSLSAIIWVTTPLLPTNNCSHPRCILFLLFWPQQLSYHTVFSSVKLFYFDVFCASNSKGGILACIWRFQRYGHDKTWPFIVVVGEVWCNWLLVMGVKLIAKLWKRVRFVLHL